MTDDRGSGRSTRCVLRVRYERAVEVGRRPDEDPGLCDWEHMTDDEVNAQVEAKPNRGWCPGHMRMKATQTLLALQKANGEPLN